MLMAANWTNLYRFPPGRAAFALQMTAERARSLQRPAERIAALASRGAEMARETLHKLGEYRSLSAGRGRFPPGTTKLDQRVDEAMVAVDGYLVVQATLFADGPRGASARRMIDSLYPEGVSQVVHLPYTAQHQRVSVILQRARSPEFAEDVAALPDLAVLLDELEARNDAYGEALKRGANRPTGSDIHAAQSRCQELLTATLFLIFADYELDGEDRRDERDHLLEPILEQNQAIRESRRRRSTPTDADPDTGDEVLDETPEDVDEDLDEDLDDALDDALDEDLDDATDEPDGDDAVEPGPGGETTGDGANVT